MQLIDQELSGKIISKLDKDNRFLVTGGSASNTISGLAKLNIPSGFFGKVGDDEMGDFFRDDCSNNGISAHLVKCPNPSGVCVSLVSPDGERTMATYLGDRKSAV